METIILILGFINGCQAPSVFNTSKENWNQEDQKTLIRAKSRCKEMYPKNNPCLKFFKKTEPRTYQAICGGKK